MYALNGLCDFGISIVMGIIEGDEGGAAGGVFCPSKATGRRRTPLQIASRHLQAFENEITMR
jgi:hypothetical protein